MEPTMMQKLLAFLNKSPSCYHAAENVAQELIKNGYEQLWEQKGWNLSEGGRYFVMRGDASIIAFRVPKREFRGFLISAAHSDSPTFKVREEAEVSGAGNCVRLSVEPYGGMIMRSWMDRPLSVAGRIMVRTENGLECRLVCVDRDLLVIPSVAIHMDREVNKGTALKANVDMLPLFSQEKGAFRRIVAKSAGVAEEDILTTDLFLYSRTPATLTGAEGEFVAGSRLDDLQCVFGCMEGFLSAKPCEKAPVLAIFHNEEVGSGTRQGADSTFLSDVLRRVNGALGRSEEDYLTAVADSFLISADNAHAVHPAHPEFSDGTEAPVLNGGIVVKYNAAQHYTTDAVSDAVFRQLCEMAGAAVQRYSNRADLPGGSTLGNISTAHVSVRSVDIGLPQLAMHAAYEVAGSKDTEALVKVMAAYYGSNLSFDKKSIKL